MPCAACLLEIGGAVRSGHIYVTVYQLLVHNFYCYFKMCWEICFPDLSRESHDASVGDAHRVHWQNKLRKTLVKSVA